MEQKTKTVSTVLLLIEGSWNKAKQQMGKAHNHL
jgi:hypothetical protein